MEGGRVGCGEDGLVGEAVRGLEKLAGELEGCKSDTEKFLLFAAWLNELLEMRGLGRVIVVGGLAAELWSGRAYRTGDVDLIIEGASEFVKDLLRRVSDVGLRVYLLKFPGLTEKAVDIVGDSYGKQKPPSKVVIHGRRVYVEPPEETILTYLVGWRYWNSLEDRDKAYLVYAVQRGRIDLGYLKERAAREGVADLLDELEEGIGKIS